MIKREIGRMRISVNFREELVGDESGSDDFYLKLTPSIKIKKADIGQEVLNDILLEAVKRNLSGVKA